MLIILKLTLLIILTVPGRAFKILCYGDSLTYGWSNGGREETPYAPVLQQALATRGVEATVRHWGGPGKTARELVDPALGGPNGANGLVTLLRKCKGFSPGASLPLLCVIMIGTNDLAQVGLGSTADSIYSDIENMHELAKGEGAKTLAVTLPGSGMAERFPEAEKARVAVNERIRSDLDTDIFEFPFPYSDGDERWDPDGLHFSPYGYEALGVALADPILDLVLEEDKPFDGMSCGAFKMQQLKGGDQQRRIAKFLAERQGEKYSEKD